MPGTLRQMHVSGAEGLYPQSRISETIASFLKRAIDHPRGRPQEIVLSLEEIKSAPLRIMSLPVRTLKCSSPANALKFIRRVLSGCGISSRAAENAVALLYAKDSMRGASVMQAATGRRMEPDRQRGVRVSRVGISSRADKLLSARLDARGIDTATVKEAIILASKVASCSSILAELCISDDPLYTTGYKASRTFGYIRIPHIKKRESMSGGRVFFLKQAADVNQTIAYLESVPVMVTSVSDCAGIIPVDEITHSHNI